MQALLVSVLFLSATAAPASPPLDDIELRDVQGNSHRVGDGHDQQLLVIAFLGNECPLARLYSGRLAEVQREFEPRAMAFTRVNSHRSDSPSVLSPFPLAHTHP